MGHAFVCALCVYVRVHALCVDSVAGGVPLQACQHLELISWSWGSGCGRARRHNKPWAQMRMCSATVLMAVPGALALKPQRSHTSLK